MPRSCIVVRLGVLCTHQSPMAASNRLTVDCPVCVTCWATCLTSTAHRLLDSASDEPLPESELVTPSPPHLCCLYMESKASSLTDLDDAVKAATKGPRAASLIRAHCRDCTCTAGWSVCRPRVGHRGASAHDSDFADARRELMTIHDALITRPRVAPPCLLRVSDACPDRVPRPVDP